MKKSDKNNLFNQVPMQGRKLGDLLGKSYDNQPDAAPKISMPSGIACEIWLIKKGHAANPVSVIRKLHKSESEMNDVLKKLKSSLACGGTFKGGEIILQSTARERIQSELVKLKIPSKICGG